MEGGQQRGQHNGAPGYRDTDVQMALTEVFNVLQLTGVVVHTAEDLLRIPLEGKPRVSQRERCPPVEQLYVVVFLQLGDMGAQGLLRDEQALGGPGDVALLGESKKIMIVWDHRKPHF